MIFKGGYMKIITREFNNIGEKITIQLKYEDLEVSKLPDRCEACPVGLCVITVGENIQ